MFENSIPQLYTNVGTHSLVINGMSLIPVSTEIALYYTIPSADSFSFNCPSAKNIENLDIFLLDKEKDTIIRFSPGFTYNFYSETSNAGTRFSLIFSKKCYWNGTGTINTTSNWQDNIIPVNGNSIEVQSGELIIDENIYLYNILVKEGAGLTIEDLVTVDVKADISIKSDTAKSGSLITNGNLVVKGKSSYQQFLTGIESTSPQKRAWYISSPLNSAGVPLLFDSTAFNIWEYSENEFKYNEISKSSIILEKARGYSVLLKNDTTILLEADNFNSGELSFGGLTRTGTSNDKRGFHLIGNPYPSYLNWDSVIKTNVSPTIWYRTANSTNEMLFDTYNSLNGFGTNNNGKGAVTEFIPPIQSLWIRVKDDFNTGNLIFNNSMRSHQVNNPLKSFTEKSFIRIIISDNKNSDESIVVFDHNAEDGFEDYDSEKMFPENNLIPQLYSISNNHKLVINSMKSPKDVNIYFKCGKKADYELKLSDYGNLDGYTFELNDIILNKKQILDKDNVYQFNSDKCDTLRFLLRFKSVSDTPSAENDITEKVSAIDIKTSKNAILVSIQGEKGNYIITDVIGRIYSKGFINTSITNINLPENKGVYFIKVEIPKKTEIKKIVVLD